MLPSTKQLQQNMLQRVGPVKLQNYFRLQNYDIFKTLNMSWQNGLLIAEKKK